jgi:hypothetical protein
MLAGDNGAYQRQTMRLRWLLKHQQLPYYRIPPFVDEIKYGYAIKWQAAACADFRAYDR